MFNGHAKAVVLEQGRGIQKGKAGLVSNELGRGASGGSDWVSIRWC